jgi:hypothetical protein
VAASAKAITITSNNEPDLCTISHLHAWINVPQHRALQADKE